GSSVGYRGALLRFLPEFLLWLLASIALAMPLFEITDPEFQSLGFNERNRLLYQLAPPWYGTVEVFEQIWIWIEFVVMMTNETARVARLHRGNGGGHPRAPGRHSVRDRRIAVGFAPTESS